MNFDQYPYLGIKIIFAWKLIWEDGHPLNKDTLSRLCSSRSRWSLAPNFCLTRKSQIFHTNHMLGSLDFTRSENWTPCNVP